MPRPIRVKGFHIFVDRHGKQRCYHRQTRTAIDLAKAPLGSAEFIAECARIAALSQAAGPPKPGTLGLLIVEYRGSAAFVDLAERTRADYQRAFDYLRPIADTPLARFDRPLVVRIRDKAAEKHGRRFGNHLKAVLSIILASASSAAISRPTRPARSRTFAAPVTHPRRTGHGRTRSATPFSTPRLRTCVRPSR